MGWLRNLWRDLVDYAKWGTSVDNEPFVKDIREAFDKADKYDLLHRHYPNIIARLNAAAERKEK